MKNYEGEKKVPNLETNNVKAIFLAISSVALFILSGIYFGIFSIEHTCLKKQCYQEEQRTTRANLLQKGEIWAHTPAGIFKHRPVTLYLMMFSVELNKPAHLDYWSVWGNCFDQTIFFPINSDNSYAHMLHTDHSTLKFWGPLDQEALSRGICYFYISLESSPWYIPRHKNEDSLYPQAVFKDGGLTKKGILQKIQVSLTLNEDPAMEIPLKLNVVEGIGDYKPINKIGTAGSKVFKVEIPNLDLAEKEGKNGN